MLILFSNFIFVSSSLLNSSGIQKKYFLWIWLLLLPTFYIQIRYRISYDLTSLNNLRTANKLKNYNIPDIYKYINVPYGVSITVVNKIHKVKAMKHISTPAPKYINNYIFRNTILSKFRVDVLLFYNYSSMSY